MVAGRPRIYDYDKEADDLLEWSNLDDSLSLYEFTDTKPYLAQDLVDFAAKSDKFSLALKKAKERIGKRREKLVHLQQFNYGIWNRSARLYDPLMKQQEDSDKDDDLNRTKSLEEHKAKLRAESDQSVVSDAVKELSHEIRRRNHITNPEG